jgi:hypothetical protein
MQEALHSSQRQQRQAGTVCSCAVKGVRLALFLGDVQRTLVEASVCTPYLCGGCLLALYTCTCLQATSGVCFEVCTLQLSCKQLSGVYQSSRGMARMPKAAKPLV